MNAWEEGPPLPPPKGASNPQPVLRDAGVATAQNWSTGEHLCGEHLCDANALAEELEPLWFTALLLGVPEVFISFCTGLAVLVAGPHPHV
jgi:hypothetical protein